MKHVIAMHGLPSAVMSDKGSAFTSTFFTKINELLGIRISRSASLNPRSNGKAESCVKRLIELLKMYASDDLSIEEKLPLIEMSMRAMAHSRLELSPFEVLFGRQMNLHAPGEPDPTLPFTGDKATYYNWLAREMTRLHAAVKERNEEIKVQDKIAYDKANRVQIPQWSVGDRVWVYDVRVKPNSDRIITNKRYHGPYLIREIVAKSPGVGQAYSLIRESDGKPLRHLVFSDRLKACNTNRAEFNKRLPRLRTTSSRADIAATALR